MKIELSILESVAHVLGKHSKFHKAEAAMLACNFATEIGNYLSQETVNEFFTLFGHAVEREGRR